MKVDGGGGGGQSVQVPLDNACSFTVRRQTFSDVYDVQAEIGRGKFAVVKRCVHRETGDVVAAKYLHKRRRGRDCQQDVLHEVNMLRATHSCRHIVNLIEVFETNHDYILVTEFVEGGELFHYIDVDGRLDERTVVRLMRQILDAVSFLHSNNILHLDIKPQNILLTDVPSVGDIKLCDFGLAKPFNRGTEVVELVGTLDYVAPEVLDYVPLCSACDMWSVGVLAYVMLTGCSPFAGESKQETLLNISQVNVEFHDELFDSVSPSAVDFIRKLLVRQPSERMTAQECLQHSWLVADAVDDDVTKAPQTAGERDGGDVIVNDRQQSELTANDVEPSTPTTAVGRHHHLHHDDDDDQRGVANDDDSSAQCASATCQQTPAAARRQHSSSVDSPSGLRRALLLTLSGDDDVIVDHEPTKRYRCDVTNCDVVAMTSSAALHVTYCDNSSVLPATPVTPVTCVTRLSVA